MDETGKEETIIFLCRQLMNSTEQVMVKHGHLEKTRILEQELELECYLVEKGRP